jgi:hypothetical protein
MHDVEICGAVGRLKICETTTTKVDVKLKISSK